MKRERWSDTDKYFGPFTYAHGHSRLGALLVSGCSFRMHLGKHTLIVALPSIIKHYREKVVACSWDAATVALIGSNWYWIYDRREYGFSLSDGDFFQIFFGRQTHAGDCRKERRWSYFLPWKQWNHVRHSLYGLNGEHFATEKLPKAKFGTPESCTEEDEWSFMQSSCPTRTFLFADFDGEQIACRTQIKEREWHRGSGSFKWLLWFMKPQIRRSLDLNFSKETGRQKGSWKGGTTGHSIEMLSGELHEAAFRRYCTGEDRSGDQTRDMKFISEISA